MLAHDWSSTILVSHNESYHFLDHHQSSNNYPSPQSEIPLLKLWFSIGPIHVESYMGYLLWGWDASKNKQSLTFIA